MNILKKSIYVSCLLFILTTSIKAQVGVGTTTPETSAMLEVKSTSKGFLLPRVTATEKNSIVSPATGLIVYQTDGTKGFYYYEGSSWNLLPSASNVVPYTLATGPVNLGSYDLTVNNITIGRGTGNISSNTVNGYQSLYSNTSGSYNTVNGYQSLYSNTSGSYNIANGYQALYSNITGWYNTATGYSALISNTTGYYNVSIGNNSLFGNTTGSYNTALGHAAGSSFATGNNCTMIGYGAQASASSVSNQITLGNSSISSLRCYAPITNLSDRRDKTDIIPIGEGLAFLKQLNPVSFTWNTRDKAKVGIKSAGFIAQELLALQKQSNIGDNLDLVSEDNPEKLEARYGNLLPVIVKAIQEESAEKDKEILVLKIKSTEKDAEIDALKQRLDALEKRFNQMLTKSNK